MYIEIYPAFYPEFSPASIPNIFQVSRSFENLISGFTPEIILVFLISVRLFLFFVLVPLWSFSVFLNGIYAVSFSRREVSKVLIMKTHSR